MRKVKIGINGFGRIGREVFREVKDNYSDYLEVVAINDLGAPNQLAHLLFFDSAYGKWGNHNIKVNRDVSSGIAWLEVDGESVTLYSFDDPKRIPWADSGAEIIVEASGRFLDFNGAYSHISAGAKRVLLTAPSKSNEVKTIVYGVNESILLAEDKVVSAASCTTNCLAPVAQVIKDNFGIKSAFMTTIHAVTSDQRVVDSSHSDLRRARSSLNNIIPTSTGAAKAIYKVIPDLKGKLDGISIRVPVITGSLVDLSVVVEKSCSVQEINDAFKRSVSDVLGYLEVPVVSTDIIGDNHGGLFDSLLTSVVKTEGEKGKMIKVFAWYDNESSYVSQFARTLKYFSELYLLST